MDEEQFELQPIDSHSKPAWQRPSKWFFIAIGVSILLAVGGYFLVPKKKVPPLPDAPSPVQEGLALEDTRYQPLVGESRYIAGTVRNKTNRTQRDVLIVFRLGAAGERDIGEVEAMIPEIQAGEAAPFKTTKAIPDRADRWVVATLRSLR